MSATKRQQPPWFFGAVQSEELSILLSAFNRFARHAIGRALQFDNAPASPLPACADDKNRLLYLHIPFCESLCPYCSFNRVVYDEALNRRYWKALRQEIALYKKKGYDFNGVYVGGGTPTIQIDELAETLDYLRAAFSIKEISVETNPNHLDAAHVEPLRRCGVNRLSIGIQSFDDGLLKAMGRYEKYGSGAEILERLRALSGRFDTINADMIFNFAAQTDEILSRDLDMLLDSGVDQVTYYPLMASDATRSQMERNIGSVDYRREEQYYYQVVNRLLPTYQFSSVWCFSRKPAMVDEYIISYDEYAGIGSGAFGYLNGTCYANTFDITGYIDSLSQEVLPLMASRTFSVSDRVRYDLLMMLFGLHLDFDAFKARYGESVWSHLAVPFMGLRMLGVIGNRLGEYYVTDKGRYYALVMMREFFIAVNNFRDFCRNHPEGRHGAP